MSVKLYHRTCDEPGCETAINPRARLNLCAVHVHNPRCNCYECGRKRARILRRAEQHVPHSRITLPPLPWAKSEDHHT